MTCFSNTIIGAKVKPCTRDAKVLLKTAWGKQEVCKQHAKCWIRDTGAKVLRTSENGF